MSTCTIPDFNNKSNEELMDLYNSYTTDASKNSFNICYLNGYGTNISDNDVFETTNNIQEALDSYEDELQKTKNAESINENTISLYNNDLLYIILKLSLFVILGAVYVIYVKNLNFLSMAQNIKDKTINLTQKIKNTSSTLATGITTQTQTLDKKIVAPTTNTIK